MKLELIIAVPNHLVISISYESFYYIFCIRGSGDIAQYLNIVYIPILGNELGFMSRCWEMPGMINK